MKPQIPGMMGMGLNPAMFGMQGMPPGFNPYGQGMMQGMMPGMMPGMTPIAIQGPNGTMMVMMPNLMGQGQPQNPNASQGQGGNQTSQIPGLNMPPGFAFNPSMMNPFGMGMNPFNPNQINPNSGDKNANPMGMTGPNQLMMGMMPPMMNPAMLNQLMQEQNKAFFQKK